MGVHVRQMAVGLGLAAMATLACAKGQTNKAVDEFVGHPNHCAVMLATDEGRENDGADYFYGRALSAAVDSYSKAANVAPVAAVEAIKAKCQAKAGAKTAKKG